MKLRDFQHKCPGVRLQLGELEIDPTRLIEHKIHGHSTCNNIFEFAKAFVKISCPSCKKNMKIDGGGGNSESHTINFKCACGTKFHMTMPNDGMSFEFKEEQA